MRKDDVVLILCVLGVIGYLLFVLSCLETLGIMNRDIKRVIFQHYNVPLPKE